MKTNSHVKTTMVIPSYWARPTDIGHKQGDTVYDHPIPLDRDGTLQRALRSLSILEDNEFNVVVLSVATTTDIENEVEKKIKDIVNNVNSPIEIRILSRFGEKMVQDYLQNKNCPDKYKLLLLSGYSRVRNMCLLAAHLCGANVAVLIDDDEVFEDPHFMQKAKEFIGSVHDNQEILGIAGYYINPDNSFMLNRPVSPWMAYWDKTSLMNRAFKSFIGSGPRLKRTPFVFGGNMVIHKKLWLEIPFDPDVPRGEDIDYLCNAKMFGYDFYIDRELAIKHDPPPKSHPKWQQFREDMFRFIYMRKKLLKQKEIPGMTRLKPSDFDPYPGAFIKDDLEELIFKANTMLGQTLLAEGDINGLKECQKNILMGKEKLHSDSDPFENLLKIKANWREMMKVLDNDEARAELKGCFI